MEGISNRWMKTQSLKILNLKRLMVTDRLMAVFINCIWPIKQYHHSDQHKLNNKYMAYMLVIELQLQKEDKQ